MGQGAQVARKASQKGPVGIQEENPIGFPFIYFFFKLGNSSKPVNGAHKQMVQCSPIASLLKRLLSVPRKTAHSMKLQLLD